MKTLRLFLLRKGFIKPKSLKESREVFTFPYQPTKQQNQMHWVTRHIERMPRSSQI